MPLMRPRAAHAHTARTGCAASDAVFYAFRAAQEARSDWQAGAREHMIAVRHALALLAETL